MVRKKDLEDEEERGELGENDIPDVVKEEEELLQNGGEDDDDDDNGESTGSKIWLNLTDVTKSIETKR
jgi:hypothetical protein